MIETTKPGKYGTLHLFSVEYVDNCDAFNTGAQRIWAYNWEHAEEKFYDSCEDDDGWRATAVKKVRESGAANRRAGVK